MNITKDMLSSYCKEIDQVKKLIPKLKDKKSMYLITETYSYVLIWD